MPDKPVIILGGGINGAAAVRELLLNGVSVWLIDTADLAYGATAYSSRLIHGGLRYLEFGEFSLVKESLDERARLLRLAPHLVKPLRLFIPVQNQWAASPKRASNSSIYFRRERRPSIVASASCKSASRCTTGIRQVAAYRPCSLHRGDESNVPHVNPAIAEQMWAYSDAQISYPERLVIGFLADAKQLAWEKGLDFRVFTYCLRDTERPKH